MKPQLSKDLYLQYQNAMMPRLQELEALPKEECIAGIEKLLQEFEQVRYDIDAAAFKLVAESRTVFELRDKVTGRLGIMDPNFKAKRDSLVKDPNFSMKMDFEPDTKKLPKQKKEKTSKEDQMKAALGGFSLQDIQEQIKRNKEEKKLEPKLESQIQKTSMTQEEKDELRKKFMARFRKESS